MHLVILHKREGHDLRGKGEICSNGLVRIKTETNDTAMEMKVIKSYMCASVEL